MSAAESRPYKNPQRFQPVTVHRARNRCAALLVCLVMAGATVACKTGKRSYSKSTSSTADEASGVQPAGDPRFPTSYATNRKGYWVDIPRRTGTVSPTDVARAVAGQIDRFSTCCRFCDGRRGQFSLQFRARPNGSVREVELIESPTSDDTTRKCIKEAATAASLPSAERPYEVIVPLHFDLRSAPDAG